MKTVYTATRRDNLRIALDPDSGIYDKGTLELQSSYSGSIYVYPDIQGLQKETLALLFQAVLFDMMQGIPVVILQGEAEDPQIQRDENDPIARKVGLRLRIVKIFELNGNSPVPTDITAQYLKN